MTAVEQRPSLSKADFIAALRDLLSSPAEAIRLKRKADIFAQGAGMEGGDLLQEAVRRTLEDDGRNCPASVDVAVYLGNVMRSIASDERRKYARETPSGHGHDDQGIVGRAADDAPSPENVVLGRVDLERTVARIEAMFGDDPQAMAVVVGALQEWSPDEIKEMESMDDKQYATARRRVRRALAREFGGKDQA